MKNLINKKTSVFVCHIFTIIIFVFDNNYNELIILNFNSNENQHCKLNQQLIKKTTCQIKLIFVKFFLTLNIIIKKKISQNMSFFYICENFYKYVKLHFIMQFKYN